MPRESGRSAAPGGCARCAAGAPLARGAAAPAAGWRGNDRISNGSARLRGALRELRDLLMDLAEHRIGRDEALGPDPGLAGRAAEERDRRVVHLVAAIRIECALRGNARFNAAGEEVPLRAGLI